MIAKSVRCVSMSVLALALLAGCGDKSESKSATQVAARVDGSEISVHQINFAMQQAKVPSDQAKAASTQILDRLIDQEVIVQKALQQKLDRDPQVMQQLEFARREVLQRAYAERVAAAVKAPDDLMVKDYFAKHPELFSERRIFTYRVLVVQGDQAQLETAQKLIAQAKNLDELVVALKQNNLRFAGDSATRAAEQIPMQMLPNLHKLKDGQVATIKRPGAIELVQLLQSRTEPVSEERARPIIVQFLTNQGKTEAVQNDIKDLRSKAKVEYMGEFKAAKEQADQSAPAAAPAAAPAPAPAPAPAASAPAISSDLEKGIGAGLK